MEAAILKAERAQEWADPADSNKCVPELTAYYSFRQSEKNAHAAANNVDCAPPPLFRLYSRGNPDFSAIWDDPADDAEYADETRKELV